MKTMKILTILVTTAGYGLGLCAVCTGKTITVDVNGGADFNSIQAAIDSAFDYDQIEVAPGTYNEAINFLGKSVRLYSSSGSEVTIIDGEGCYHVVQCVSGEGSNTILDGFTITGGIADGNCVTCIRGGGMYNENSSPTVTNCTFTSNSAHHGSGMYNEYSSPMVTNCTFKGNGINVSDYVYGGGMCNDSDSSPIINNCTFSDNNIINPYMYSTYGGGIYNQECSRAMVTNCTFSKNRASYGGGICNHGGGLITNCTFIGNWVDAYSDTFPTGKAEGGGALNVGSTISNCTFIGNSAVGIGGGIFNLFGVITNCIFIGNLALVGGLGGSNYPPSCGGGMFNVGGTITNCTFSGNSADANGGGICNYAFQYDLRSNIINCIFWDNPAETNGNEIALISSHVGSLTVDVNYCDVRGGQEGIYTGPNCVLNWGPGNVDTDPCFVNANNNDFHLDFNSPCIDAGDNTAIHLGVDLDGHPRFVDDPCTIDTGNGTSPIIDMGAYEYRLGPSIYKDSDNAGDCVEPGYEINYRIDYNYPNWNQQDINDVNIIDYLPEEVNFILASDDYNQPDSNKILWHIGTLSPGVSDFVTLKVRVKESISPCGSIINRCELRSDGHILGSTSEYTAVCVGNSIIVENFDEYRPPASAADLRAVWKDYYTQDEPKTSAEVCPAQNPHRGGESSWSMEYDFLNKSYEPYYSEVRADVNTAWPNGLGMDPKWLGMGAKALVLWFFGLPTNGPDEEMYIKLTDGNNVTGKVTYSGDMNDIREPWWHQWNINLQEFIDNNNVNLADVKRITIGFGDGIAPRGDGTVWFEDVQLSTCGCFLSKRSDKFTRIDYAPPGNPPGDCMIDYLELEMMVDNWLMASPPSALNVDVHYDGTIDFKDFALVADMWLVEELWPYE